MSSSSAELRFNEWARYADEDQKMTEIALKEDGPPNQICFHSQQIAEKYLKGYLVFLGKEFEKSHLLRYLIELCEEVDSEFRELEDDIIYLTQFYIETRYPGDIPEFNLVECRKALEAALRIKEFVLKKIGRGAEKGFFNFGVAIAIVIIAAAAIGGGLYWREVKNVEKINRDGIEARQKAEELMRDSQKHEENSVWQIYRNNKYKYEISFPDEFKVFTDVKETCCIKKIIRGEEVEVSDFIIVPPTGEDRKVYISTRPAAFETSEPVYISIEVSDNRIDVIDYVKFLKEKGYLPPEGDNTLKSKGHGLFKGGAAYIIKSEFGLDSYGSSILFNHDGKTVFIHYNGDTKVYEDIVNSFNVVYWETYRNEKYGFEIGYPVYYNVASMEDIERFTGNPFLRVEWRMRSTGYEGPAGFFLLVKRGTLLQERGEEPKVIGSEQISIGGKSREILIKKYAEEAYLIDVHFSRGEDNYWIGPDPSSPATLEFFKEVLSTFKFIDK